MPKFEFKAFTREGKLKEGIISAETKEAALKILQSQELLVTYLSEKKVSFLSFLQKPNLKDLYIFTRQLSYLIKAKNPLDEAIKSLSETTTNYAFRSILIDVHKDLISGVPFSDALGRFPEIFNDYYIGMIKVGESVGSLDEVLDYLAEHLNNQIRFKNRMIQASIYPAIVLVIFIGVMLALFYFVIPQITKMFIENNIPLPTVTKVFQAISDFLLKFGIFALIIFAALIYYFNQYLKTKEGKLTLFKIVNNLPVFGPLVKNLYAAQFLESLYYLVKGGVPMVEALEIIKSSIAHPLYESALEYVIEDVKRGKPLSESLSQFPELFPSLIIEGMKTSEKTGQLAEITKTIYNFYNETVENQVANIGEALQPFLIIIMGIGLGLLEASLLIPLLNLTKYVQTF
ncbi:MAG: secretion system protein [Candidatus Parcubacteria bacterium]|nr:MAG: secretion system protein [Candidatus Parcubacteria bacterium]